MALAKSNSIPATSFPISDVMSEHCRSVAAQNWPAIPYSLYGVASAAPPAGGLTRASRPPVADSGCGLPGWHRLFSAPIAPDDPREQNPSSPPMSPIPGTEHGPPAAGVVAATVVTLAVAGVAAPGAVPLPGDRASCPAMTS